MNFVKDFEFQYFFNKQLVYYFLKNIRKFFLKSLNTDQFQIRFLKNKLNTFIEIIFIKFFNRMNIKWWMYSL